MTHLQFLLNIFGIYNNSILSLPRIKLIMEKILAENIKRICRERKMQLKDLAFAMGIDASSLNRAMYGNARLDTIEKIAKAFGVSVKSLFEPTDEENVEGYIKIRGKIYQFNNRQELYNILEK